MKKVPSSVLAEEEAATTPGRVRVSPDLFSWPPLRWLLTSPFYPGALQAISILIFGFILYFAFFGTIRPGRNFATVVTWTIWWPLLPLSLLIAGRLWCAICPFTPAIASAQQVTHPRRFPGAWLRRYSIWLMAFSFLFLTWIDRVWGFTISPRATGFLLLGLLAAAVGLGLLYRRRAFCRHICPIGALTGIYATTAVMEVKNRGGSCQGCPQLCYRGSPKAGGCPLYQFPKTMEGGQNCNLCAQCLKVCPQDNLGLRLRFPGQGLWNLAHPHLGEAVLAVMLLALVFIQTFDMSSAWGSYMKWWMETAGIRSYLGVLSITFVGGVIIALAAYALVTYLARPRSGWAKEAAVYGYAYIPLALAVHLSHNTGHLVSEGPIALRTAIANLANLVRLTYEVNYSSSGAPLFSMAWMLLLIVPGALFSLIALRQIRQNRAGRGEPSRILPHMIFLLMLTALFVGLFALPMNPRHSH